MTNNGERLLDIGCGSGAFSIGAALRGYESLGLSWDEENQKKAILRASLCGTKSAHFDVLDIRTLETRKDLKESFDIAISLEAIEHILDDRKLIQDIAACLKPGGRLYLTTPYYYYRAITAGDNGPFITEETGWHVRRGYTTAMLQELCDAAGLVLEEVSYCSGLLSQKLALVQRKLENTHFLLSWLAILPFRILPPLFDPILTKILGWPGYSICIEAYKPRRTSG